jgi:hypothetical protein
MVTMSSGGMEHGNWYGSVYGFIHDRGTPSMIEPFTGATHRGSHPKSASLNSMAVSYSLMGGKLTFSSGRAAGMLPWTLFCRG